MTQTIAALAARVPGAVVRGRPDVVPAGIAYDSRASVAGSLFACWQGAHFDGHRYAADAVSKGAVALLCERPLAYAVPQIVVPDSRIALALISAAFYKDPSEQLSLIGVTGTNGKTTMTYLIKAILEAAGRRCGLIGTVGHFVGGEQLPSARTTPEAPDIQRLLSQMVAAECDACVMEASSHGIDKHRVAGCTFSVGVFTNLTQDHLDYHKTLEAYREAKCRLFHQVRDAAVINLDDPHAQHFISAARSPVLSYAIDNPTAAFRAGQIRVGHEGVSYIAHTPAGSIPVSMRLTGRFNVYNSLAAMAATYALGCSPAEMTAGLANVQVPGRFERVIRGQDFLVIVDYAHTPDGLENVLKTSRQLATGRVIAVYGAGGDRDRTKRPQMGALGARLADFVIITSDNPRSEEPAQICREIEAGVRSVGGSEPRYRVVVDRREAIRVAVAMARPGDVLLIAGKGHETYQEFADATVHFDDREEAARALEERMKLAETNGP